MRTDGNKTGFTLNELLVVIAVLAVLVGIGAPATRALLRSFESSAQMGSVISAALSNAKAIAAKGKYTGIRFQQDLDGNQYMIFIVNEVPAKMGGLTNGFRAVKGRKPLKFPANVGVMHFIGGDAEIDEEWKLRDATTFSIIFSKTGKLIIHPVRVRNKDGEVDSNNNTGSSNDQVFNKKGEVEAIQAMFYQDDYFGDSWSPYPTFLGLGEEPSQNSFVIYDKKTFEAVNAGSRWTDYLKDLEVLYVNPYTGRIIR